MGLILHFQEVKTFSTRDEKNQKRYKEAFFYIFNKQKKIKVLGQHFLKMS